MKFTQSQLERLHRAAQRLNELNLGGYSLADRLALYLDEEVRAIAIKNEAGKYEIELIEDELIQNHEKEVDQAKEVDY